MLCWVSVEGTGGRRGSSREVLALCRQRAAGSLPAGGWPPFRGESRTCTSFAIARACRCGALEAGCQLLLPHCSLLYMGWGRGPLRALLSSNRLVTQFSGNLHLLGKFSPRRKLSFIPFIWGGREDGFHRKKVRGWSSGDFFFLQLFISQVCMVHPQCDRPFIMCWQDKIFASGHLQTFWRYNYKTKHCAFASVFAIVNFHTKKITGDVHIDFCTRIVIYIFSFIF